MPDEIICLPFNLIVVVVNEKICIREQHQVIWDQGGVSSFLLPSFSFIFFFNWWCISFNKHRLLGDSWKLVTSLPFAIICRRRFCGAFLGAQNTFRQESFSLKFLFNLCICYLCNFGFIFCQTLTIPLANKTCCLRLRNWTVHLSALLIDANLTWSDLFCLHISESVFSYC